MINNSSELMLDALSKDKANTNPTGKPPNTIGISRFVLLSIPLSIPFPLFRHYITLHYTNTLSDTSWPTSNSPLIPSASAGSYHYPHNIPLTRLDVTRPYTTLHYTTWHDPTRIPSTRPLTHLKPSASAGSYHSSHPITTLHDTTLHFIMTLPTLSSYLT